MKTKEKDKLKAKFTYTSPLTGKKTKGTVDEVLKNKVRVRPEDKTTEELYMRSTDGVLFPINDNLDIYE